MNEDVAKAIKDAIEASPVLKASEIEIVSLRESFDIDSNRNRVRVELTFDIR